MTRPAASRYPQMPLGLHLRDDATFANFLAGANGAAVAALQHDQERMVYLWGAPGSGKSHLLQAACHTCTTAGGGPVYLPLGEHESLAPAVLEGLERAPLIAIDDLHAVAGRSAWEHGLFHLCNRVRDAGGRLLVASAAPPAGLGLELADLLSRLTWGPVFHLQPLDDQQKVAALQERAARRGLELGPEVAGYLLKRCPRDLHSLFQLLERLDHASLAAQRRLTIPFVRELLD